METSLVSSGVGQKADTFVDALNNTHDSGKSVSRARSPQKKTGASQNCDSTTAVCACGRPVRVKKRGLCRSCYRKALNQGGFTKIGSPAWRAEYTEGLKGRLLSRLKIEADCHLWQGSANAPRGNETLYGSMAVSAYWSLGKSNYLGPHIVAYRLYKGDIPAGHCLKHTCGNTLCCNPAHLVALPNNQVGRGRPRKVA